MFGPKIPVPRPLVTWSGFPKYFQATGFFSGPTSVDLRSWFKLVLLNLGLGPKRFSVSCGEYVTEVVGLVNFFHSPICCQPSPLVVNITNSPGLADSPSAITIAGLTVLPRKVAEISN